MQQFISQPIAPSLQTTDHCEDFKTYYVAAPHQKQKVHLREAGRFDHQLDRHRRLKTSRTTVSFRAWFHKTMCAVVGPRFYGARSAQLSTHYLFPTDGIPRVSTEIRYQAILHVLKSLCSEAMSALPRHHMRWQVSGQQSGQLRSASPLGSMRKSLL